MSEEQKKSRTDRFEKSKARKDKYIAERSTKVSSNDKMEKHNREVLRSVRAQDGRYKLSDMYII